MLGRFGQLAIECVLAKKIQQFNFSLLREAEQRSGGYPDGTCEANETTIHSADYGRDYFTCLGLIFKGI